MKVRRVQIEQEMARIRVESQMASLSIETSKRGMTVENTPARMSAERRDGTVEIDMADFRDNIGLKSIQTLAAENAARAQAQVEQSIRRLAGEADYIGTLPHAGNPIAEVARNKMLESKVPDMNSGEVPDGAIGMRGEPGSVAIDWSRHDLKINWDEFQSPVITVEPKASVDVQVVRKPTVEYTVVELTIPPETGRTIDAEA